MRALHSAHVTVSSYLADGLPKVGINGNAPGKAAATDLLGALMFYGLISGLGCLLVSTIVFGLGRYFSHHGSAVAGRVGILAGLAVAILVGGASSLINWAFGLGATI
ncbi:DUF6112 family protein [Streptomyces celluloflavus]|uniref:DUF6112 family protein n=1 Tax=Streptomyces celluloflavus TaxID=58344 RepID=UPI0036C5B25D